MALCHSTHSILDLLKTDQCLQTYRFSEQILFNGLLTLEDKQHSGAAQLPANCV
jgi:hypothetical protein